MNYSVDRIEGDIIVLIGDDDTKKVIKRKKLPDAHEGDIVRICCGRITADDGEAKRRKEQNHSRLSRLFKK